MEQMVLQRRQRKKQPNHTGVPTLMKLKVEKKSGLSFDDREEI